MRYWVITAKADGKVLHPCFTTGDLEVPGPSNGWAWDAATQVATRLARNPDPVVQVLDGAKYVDDAKLVEAVLVVQIKDRAEQEKMVLLSTGGAKKAEYAEKRQEVVAFDTLASGVGGLVQQLTSLSTARRDVMFAHATADAAAFGDTIAAAIARFRAGINNSKSTATIAATEQVSIAKIRAAVTAADKRAIVAAIKWS